jgi:hypothetical protein
VNLVAACCCAGGGGTIGPPGPPNTCNTFDWCADPANAGVLARLDSWSQTGSRIADSSSTTDPNWHVDATQVRVISETYVPGDQFNPRRFEVVMEIDLDVLWIGGTAPCVCNNGTRPPEVQSGSITRTVRTRVLCSPWSTDTDDVSGFDPRSQLQVCQEGLSISAQQNVTSEWNWDGGQVGTCNELSSPSIEVELYTFGSPTSPFCVDQTPTDMHRITLRFGIN